MKLKIAIAVVVNTVITYSLLGQNQNIDGKLQIKDILTINNSTNDQILHLRPNSGNSGFIYWAENGVAEKGILGFEKGSKDLVFSTGGWNFSNSTERFRIKSNGHVGIGTDNPTFNLDVLGSAGATARFRGNGQSTLSLNDGVNDNYIVGKSGALSFRPSGKESLYIDNTGRVGIGTTSLKAKLTIEGVNTPYPNNRVLYINTNGESPNWRDQIMIASNLDTGYGIAFAGKGHHRGGIYAESGPVADGNITIWARNNGKINLNSKTIYLDGNTVFNAKTSSPSWKDQLKISSNLDTGYGIAFIGKGHHRGGIYAENGANADGNITIWTRNNGKINLNSKTGIGTTEIPSGFDLAIAGRTITEEIKVQLQQNWPDYVFKNDYKLPTLKEVENHILEKGHLKGIPSAKTVEENGFFLGEMDSKLLQKIEELTLYTIAQEKSIKNQSAKLEKLEKENESLKDLNAKFLEVLQRLEKLENNKKN